MSRTDITLDPVALIHDVSRDDVESLQSLLVMPLSVRRENLLAIGQAVLAAPEWFAKPVNQAAVKKIVRYYALASDWWPAFGRLLVALRDCDANETDAALERLTAVRDCDLDEIDNALVRLTEVTE